MSSGNEAAGGDATVPDEEDVVALLFDAASVFVGADERERFLRFACRGEPALLRRIEALVALSSTADDFFEFEPQVAAGEPAADTKSGEGVGVAVGRYALIERIGAGGCGVVYLAEQLEPVRRKVALKIIRLGLESPEAVARFEAERQALASMNHPNIARILDAGTTNTGRPYYVMELVDGETITSYCDSHRLGIPERLELFIAVCRAIQHAHQKSVVHRDIKPSNILIDRLEPTPVPKIIDFGIARNVAPLAEDEQAAGAVLMGTPAYMSPEQWSADGRIDTRSDIYSLGVLLTELLAGKPTHLPEDLLERTTAAIRGVITTAKPALPSEALSALPAEDRRRIAKMRDVPEDRLLAWCRRDLDWVAAKAVARDPSARYETAEALAEDIGRWLRNEPVGARPQTRRYRLAKLANRNRLWFGAGALALVGLVGGLGTATFLFFREKEARALQESLRARAEAARLAETQTRKLWEYRSRVAESAVRLRYQDFSGAEELVAPIPLEDTPPSLEAVAVFKQLAQWHRDAGRMEDCGKHYLSMVSALATIDRAHTDINSDSFLPASTALALSSDPRSYERIRGIALDLYENTSYSLVAERVLKACLLKPAPKEILARTRRLLAVMEAEAAKDGRLANDSRGLGTWMYVAIALHHYRDGNDEAARSWAHRSLASASPDPTSAPVAQAIIGMAWLRQGERLEATPYLNAAAAAARGKWGETLPHGGPTTGFWWDWANLGILLEEAGWSVADP